MVFLFYGLHYNTLSGLVIIIFSRCKRVNRKTISLCNRSDGNLLTCKIGAMVSEFRVLMKKMMKNRGKYVSSDILLPFHMFSTLNIIIRRTELKEFL